MYKTSELAQLVDAFESAQVAYEAAKTHRDSIKNELIAQVFPDPKIGTNKLVLEDGRQLRLVYYLDYKLVTSRTKGRNWDPDAVYREHVANGELPDGMIKFKPELVSAAYKALSQAQKAVASELVEVKPSIKEFVVE